MRRKKANKFSRYTKVFKRKIRKINRKKVSSWVNRNLKSHPFILGILATFWLSSVIKLIFDNRGLKDILKSYLKLLGIVSFVWLVLVILANVLKDKQKVRWYLKKRFVFTMLVLSQPFGLILLWAGAKFKKITKIVLTIIFATWFIGNSVYQEKRQHKFLNMSPFERIVEMITQQKNKVFLKSVPAGNFIGLEFIHIPENERVKLAVSDIYSRYTNSIVTIKTKDKRGKDIGMGSGFVISRDGIIITNAHVVQSAYQAEIKVGERTFQEVYLLKVIPRFDIAVLKINGRDFSPLAVGDSDKLNSGQFVVVLGNPLGFEQTVSSGIISAIRVSRNIKLIQMTAPVSPGSSGSAVLNEYGEVVGITTVASFFMAQNLNFAIPINYLKEIVKQ